MVYTEHDTRERKSSRWHEGDQCQAKHRYLADSSSSAALNTTPTTANATSTQINDGRHKKWGRLQHENNKNRTRANLGLFKCRQHFFLTTQRVRMVLEKDEKILSGCTLRFGKKKILRSWIANDESIKVLGSSTSRIICQSWVRCHHAFEQLEVEHLVLIAHESGSKKSYIWQKHFQNWFCVALWPVV